MKEVILDSRKRTEFNTRAVRAAAWNILWALNQRDIYPELDDRYITRQKEETGNV